VEDARRRPAEGTEPGSDSVAPPFRDGRSGAAETRGETSPPIKLKIAPVISECIEDLIVEEHVDNLAVRTVVVFGDDNLNRIVSAVDKIGCFLKPSEADGGDLVPGKVVSVERFDLAKLGRSSCYVFGSHSRLSLPAMNRQANW